MDGGTGGGGAAGAEEIIQGIGNEVFYFFMLLSLMLVIVGAWFSTQVVEPVVSSVILVERTAPSPDGQRYDHMARVYIKGVKPLQSPKLKMSAWSSPESIIHFSS